MDSGICSRDRENLKRDQPVITPCTHTAQYLWSLDERQHDLLIWANLIIYLKTIPTWRFSKLAAGARFLCHVSVWSIAIDTATWFDLTSEGWMKPLENL